MFVVKYRKLFFILSAILVLISVAAMFKPGFDFGIDWGFDFDIDIDLDFDFDIDRDRDSFADLVAEDNH